MKMRCLVVLLAAFVAAVRPLPAGEAHSPGTDVRSLQGTWTCISQEVNGRAVQKAAERLKLIVRDDFLLFRNGENETAMAYQLDTAATPNKIDMWEKSPPKPGRVPVVHHGTFSLEGDTLRICSGLCQVTGPDGRAESERPTEFTAAAGSARILTDFKRLGP
jgi:uncharacterized protein (TIGR03067 family)